MHDSSFALLGPARRARVVMAGLIFGLGIIVGVAFVPSLAPHARTPIAAVLADGRADAAPRLPTDPQLVYRAEVLRIIDGDTFEARVYVWPGINVDTKVRLRGIDAPELHARCSSEHVKAEAARSALETILAVGGVAISQVGVDKYGGRVDATASTRATADVSSAMLNGGWARSYDGGRRGSWCG